MNKEIKWMNNNSIKIDTKRAFCIECGNFSKYRIEKKQSKYEFKGVCFTCLEETAYCKKCGKSIYVPEINDKNAQRRLEAYHKVINLERGTF